MDADLVAHGVHGPKLVVMASSGDRLNRPARAVELGSYGVEVVSPDEELARTGWTTGFLLVHTDRELRRPETGDVIGTCQAL